MKLLPQPGPPVSTATFSVSASRTAASCSGARSTPVVWRSQSSARPSPPPAKPASRSTGASQQAQQPGGQGEFGAVEGDQVDRRARPLRTPVTAGGQLLATTPSSPTSSSRQRPASSASTSSSPVALVDQLGLGQVAVAVVGGLRQGVLQAGLDPLRAVVGDAEAWAICRRS